MNQEDKKEMDDWEFLNLAWDLEEEWLESRKKYSNKELLEIFPEVKEIIPDKITEWQEEEKKQTEVIRQKLAKIKKIEDETTKLLERELLKMDEGEELLKIGRHIARLKRLQSVVEGRSPRKGWLTDDDIQQAREVPVEEVLGEIVLKRSGSNRLVGLCPFHNERTPSFYIYQNTNRYYCFGCNKNGDTISFVRLLHSLDFVDAVRWLNEAQE